MAAQPLVSVLMPVHNCEAYVAKAIESILEQTFSHFEFIIVDDASTDDTPAILIEYARLDRRIVLLRNGTNQGMGSSLNTALPRARGAYIARQDGDDISLPTRLERQVAFLEGHNDIGISGTWLRLFGDCEQVVWEYPVEDPAVRCGLLFRSTMAHPTVMLRKQLIDNNQLRYDERYPWAEDYALWARASRYTRFSNIPEVHYLYRQHASNMCRVRRDGQRTSSARVRRDLLSRFVFDVSEEEFAIHEALASLEFDPSASFVERVRAWLLRVRRANCLAKLYPDPWFSQELSPLWYGVCRQCDDEEIRTRLPHFTYPLRPLFPARWRRVAGDAAEVLGDGFFGRVARSVGSRFVRVFGRYI